MTYMPVQNGYAMSAQQITQKSYEMTQIQYSQSMTSVSQPTSNAIANPAPNSQVTQVVIKESTVIQPVVVVAAPLPPVPRVRVKLPGDDWYEFSDCII